MAPRRRVLVPLALVPALWSTLSPRLPAFVGPCWEPSQQPTRSLASRCKAEGSPETAAEPAQPVKEQPPVPQQDATAGKTGWDVWPPSSLPDIFALYGGPRRFFIVNIPAALLFLGADLFGSMRTLLSFDALKGVVREYRLDGVYPVRGVKRHYIDEPLMSTFTFPGDWVYDPLVERALQIRRSGVGRSYASKKNPKAPLPLVAMIPPIDGKTVGQSLGLFVSAVGNASTLVEAMGDLQQAQAGIVKRFLDGSPEGSEAQGISAAAVQVGPRESYRFELRVQPAGDEPYSLYTTAQLVQGSAGKPSYLLLLTGTATVTASDEDKARIRAASESLEAL